MALVKTIGLDHVVLRCADIETSLRFYVDQLGLEPERVDEWRRGEVLFPSVRITAATIIDLFGEPGDGTNVDHLCLEIEPADLDVLADAFPGSHRGDLLFGAQGLRLEPLRAGPGRQHDRAPQLRPLTSRRGAGRSCRDLPFAGLPVGQDPQVVFSWSNNVAEVVPTSAIAVPIASKFFVALLLSRLAMAVWTSLVEVSTAWIWGW